MSTVLNLKLQGLQTFPNQLASVPEGSLFQADNVVVDRDGIVEPRRGLGLYGTLGSDDTATMSQLLTYQTGILGHIADTLCYDNGSGVFTPFSGSYTEVTPGLRIKGIEQNGNFYFTTNNGIQKISATSTAGFTSAPNYITQSGGVQAIDNAVYLDYSQNGFFAANSVVAYRTVWGFQDVNQNVILGTPSAPSVIENPVGPFLIAAFNELLAQIDASTVIGGTATNFWATLNLPFNASYSDIYTALIDLSEALDTDLGGIVYAGATYNITSSTPGNPTVLNVTPNDDLIIGQEVIISGSNSVPSIDGTYNIIAATSTTITINVATTTGPTTGTVTVNSVSTPYTTAPFPASPVSLDIANLTAFLTAISTQLGSVQNYGPITNTAASPTVLTIGPNNLSIGSQIIISGSNSTPPINGTYYVAAQPSSTTIEISTSPTLTPLVNCSGAGTTGFIVTPGFSFALPQNTNIVDVRIGIPLPQPGSIPPISTYSFYQVYRTDVVTAGDNVALSDASPGDEMRLVYEGNPTQAEINQGFVVYQDVVPDSFRDAGINLYTNENSGVGILQENNPPPMSSDITAFKSSAFFSNTSTLQNLTTELLSVLAMVSGVSTFNITNGTTTSTYTFVSGVQQVQSATATNATGLGGKYWTFYSAGNVTGYYVWYNTGTSMDPAPAGLTGIEVDVASGASATNVALATAKALSQVYDVSGVSPSSTTFSMTLANPGYATPAANGTTSFTFNTPSPVGAGENAAAQQVLISNTGSPGVDIDTTARSLVHVINSNPAELVYAFYISGASTVPGTIYLQAKNFTDPKFYLYADSEATAAEFSPTLQVPFTGDLTIGSPIITNVSPIAGGTAPAGFITGGSVYVTGTTVPLTIASPVTSNTITLTTNSTVDMTGVNFLYGIPANSDNEVCPNRVFYSVYLQPEAVPLLNYFDVGLKSRPILRIIPLRESLFIFKSDSIWRLTGDSSITGFTLNLFDSSTNILAPDTAVVLNNQIYLYSQQGVAVVSETGVSIISRPIENVLIQLRQVPGVGQTAFGVTYEADRAFLLFMPTVITDTIATQCYRYNTFTQAWTRFVITNSCGIVKPNQDVLYLGSAINEVEQERKNFERQDYADREYFTDIVANSYNTTALTLNVGSIANVGVGDSLVQTQYVTISELTRLLQKLDMDTLIADSTYLTSLAVIPGGDMYLALQNLAAKLDHDLGGTTYTTAFATAAPTDTFTLQQAGFNAIVAALNADSRVKQKNYLTSTETVVYDSNVTTLNLNTGLITIYNEVPFISGDVSVFKAIPTTIMTVPQTFSNPSLLRHVREGTFIFESSDFIGGIISYASDLRPEFDPPIPFGGDGDGVFGEFDWGGLASNTTWGGLGTSAPVRTLIPPQKQRCRWIKGQFESTWAWSKFSLYGITLVCEETSPRAYK